MVVEVRPFFPPEKDLLRCYPSSFFFLNGHAPISTKRNINRIIIKATLETTILDDLSKTGND